MKLKYVRDTDEKFRLGTLEESHKNLARGLNNLQSAGFVKIRAGQAYKVRVTVFGESVSLGLKALMEDRELIENYLNKEG